MTDLKQKFHIGSRWTHKPSGMDFVVVGVGVHEKEVLVVLEGKCITKKLAVILNPFLEGEFIPYKEPRTREVDLCWYYDEQDDTEYTCCYKPPIKKIKIIAKKTITLTEGEGI